jgi:GWxTD domain-containing protein
MIKRLLTLTLGLALIAAPGPRAAQKEPARPAKPKTEKKQPANDVKSLDPAYQEFLKLVTYIISPKEKEVFLALPDNRDRDIFIDGFWKLRDPTPGTPANEFKAEIIKRFEHVNKYFASGRPGWMTDRGRMWMILGEPISYDRFPGKSGIIPCEVWYYYTDGSKGLPQHFGLVFFQKSGVGEYKLYDPFVDGPKRLLEPMASFQQIDPDDYETVFNTIQKLAPTLANISISLIPGESGFGYQPTSRSTELLASITESPYKNLRPTYATHFFDYKGLVTTEYMTNYVESDGLATVIQDPGLDLPFIHFSVVPQKLSLNYYEANDQYYCNLKTDVSLRRDEVVVFQYSKEYALYFPAADIDRVRQNGIALEDAFPISAGQYKLTVLVQNAEAKEFTVLERSLSVPKAGGPPSLNGPFLGYKLKTFPLDVLIPFKTADRKLVVDPKMSFGADEEIDVMLSVVGLSRDLWQSGEVQLSLKGLSKNLVVRSYVLRLAESPYNKVLSLTPKLAASDLVPDYYELSARLVGSDKKVLDEKNGQFVISGEKALAHPIANSKGFSLANEFYIYYQLARQYDKMNLNEQAEANFAKGLAKNPGYKEGVSEYARFLLKVRKFDEALTVVEGLKGFEKGRYDYSLIKGLAAMGKDDFAGAIDNLLAANKIYNSDTVLLNALGSCFLKTGQKEQALNAFQASLKLKSAQPDIQKTVEGLLKK